MPSKPKELLLFYSNKQIFIEKILSSKTELHQKKHIK